MKEASLGSPSTAPQFPYSPIEHALTQVIDGLSKWDMWSLHVKRARQIMKRHRFKPRYLYKFLDVWFCFVLLFLSILDNRHYTLALFSKQKTFRVFTRSVINMASKRLGSFSSFFLPCFSLTQNSSMSFQPFITILFKKQYFSYFPLNAQKAKHNKMFV